MARAILAGLGLVLAGSAGAADPEIRFLEQNWTSAVRQEVYTLSQGSQIMPFVWFAALERADSEERFAADGLARHGYLPNPVSAANPAGLPVGFTIDRQASGWWIGMTCAACHTNQITYQGTRLQIDGAPGQADMYAMLVDLRDALQATLADPAKLDRFARRVLGPSPSWAAKAKLAGEVGAFLGGWSDFVAASTSPTPWGRSRLDAFGMIFNRVSAIDLALPANNRPPSAPVSYPFLWGTSWEDKVQWNGSAPNTNDIERLTRNIGEVLGVFARTDLAMPTLLHYYYDTSARRTNQLRIESRLKTLWSPAWPEDVLGPIDRAQASQGEALFQQNCVRCHEVVPHGQQARPVAVKLEPVERIGTDRVMVDNACNGKVLSGRLEGSRMPALIGKALERETATLDLVVNVSLGVLLSPPDKNVEAADIRSLLAAARSEPALGDAVDAVRTVRSQRERLLDELKQRLFGRLRATELTRAANSPGMPRELRDYVLERPEPDACGANSPLMAYKGRPLDGIWATAPYLHNGSVANLYEMLLPAADRLRSFQVGSQEFDPVNVGFVTTPVAGSTELNTEMAGNANAGHDTYGNATFTEAQRRALVEYMKTL